MRTLAVLLAAATGALCSSTLSGELRGRGGLDLPETDMILDSYAVDFGDKIPTIPGSFGDYAVIDDLVISWGSDYELWLDEYTTWCVTTANFVPSELVLLVVDDNYGVPAGEPISREVYPVDCYNSGFTHGGYIIWLTVMDLPYGTTVQSPVWLGPQRQDGEDWYIVAGVMVSESEAYRTVEAGWDWQPLSQELEEADIFKIIEGDSYGLQRSTWGGIKALLQ